MHILQCLEPVDVDEYPEIKHNKIAFTFSASQL